MQTSKMLPAPQDSYRGSESPPAEVKLYFFVLKLIKGNRVNCFTLGLSKGKDICGPWGSNTVPFSVASCHYTVHLLTAANFGVWY